MSDTAPLNPDRLSPGQTRQLPNIASEVTDYEYLEIPDEALAVISELKSRGIKLDFVEVTTSDAFLAPTEKEPPYKVTMHVFSFDGGGYYHLEIEGDHIASLPVTLKMQQNVVLANQNRRFVSSADYTRLKITPGSLPQDIHNNITRPINSLTNLIHQSILLDPRSKIFAEVFTFTMNLATATGLGGEYSKFTFNTSNEEMAVVMANEIENILGGGK